MRKLNGIFLGLLLGLWLCGASAQTVRIGIVNTFSGPQASFGEIQRSRPGQSGHQADRPG
jgi:hypothetical protein